MNNKDTRKAQEAADQMIDIAMIIGAHARESFEEWLSHHTLANRTPKEMYFFGFYEATYQRWGWTEHARREGYETIQERTSTGREPVSEGHVQKPQDSASGVSTDDGNSGVPVPDMRSVASHNQSEAEEQQG